MWQRIPYRLFVPKSEDKKIPLVLYLHGADAVGSDNEIFERLRNKSNNVFYEEYPTGYMNHQYGVNPYCSWGCGIGC